MAKKAMLTTIDNPFDPFDDFENWYMFDMNKQYNTCSLLARFIDISEDMNEKEMDDATEQAINQIIETDFIGIYKKVIKEDEEVPLTPP